MDTNTNGGVPQQQQQFKCTGNCLNCLPAQRAYCASQHAYSNMRVLDEVMKNMQELKSGMEEMKADIKDLATAVDEMQGYDDVYEVAAEGVNKQI